MRRYSKSGTDSDFAILKGYVHSGEFRDEELTGATYAATFDLVVSTLTAKPSSSEMVERVRDVRTLCTVIISADEFIGSDASDHMPPDLIRLLVTRASPSRINAADAENECQFIECVLRLLYQKLVKSRCRLRSEIGKFLREYTLIPTRTSHLTPVLNALNVIITGMFYADKTLFTEILLPLHKPNGWAFWDRQTPVIGEYHKALVQCCFSLIEKEKSLATDLVDYLLSHAFPPLNQSNTAKELLLLFEISKFISFVNIRQIKCKLMKKILESISSENAQIVQSVLVLWKSPPSSFPEMIRPYLHEFMEGLLLVLFRGTGEPHWNPTVNKMTLLVLKSLEESDSDLFADAARAIPPTQFKSSVSAGCAVPRRLAATTSTKLPPLEITGVAPWQNEPPSPVGSDKCSKSVVKLAGIDALREYMTLLTPVGGVAEDKPSWQLALSSETPTLLPDLKFHNLVFGRDLGIGAFSTVRYARVVKPGGTTYLSQWDEVAVKIISYEIIKANNYGENILREICALRKLSHPSIARLISSFKWRDGIYLVLEYGSLGDLHSYIARHGALSESMAKLIVGEIATALITVHESGFVYGDLKPENVVITATRHVKLADFGACRAVSAEARRLLMDSRDDLQRMRSGDWRGETPTPSLDLSDESILNPKNFEGTTAYLSPEVVGSPGAGPTVLSDAWALGMTAYFSVNGKLPCWTGEGSSLIDVKGLIETDSLFTSGSAELKSFILSLLAVDVSERSSVEEIGSHPWFEEVQDIRRLYKKELPVDHLPAVEDGTGMAAGDSMWEKRQLSKVWSAQPVDYALGVRGGPECTAGAGVIVETDVERDSPFM